MLHTEYYKDGTPCECEYMEREHYYSTALQSEIPYINGKIHGIVKFYYESGAMEWESPYTNNKKHGLYKEYSESGTLELQVPYVYNRCHGMEYDYRGSGYVKQTLWIMDTVYFRPIENFL